MLAFLLLPIYLCKKDKKSLQEFNSKVCKVVYFPIGLVVTAVFLACSLLMTPFAYFKVLIHKTILSCKKR